jgi:hypothetical protein
VLTENPLHRDRVRVMSIEPFLEPCLDVQQPLGKRHIGRRPDDTDGDKTQRTPGDAVDHADPAAGQPRIDPKHPHAHSDLLHNCSPLSVPGSPHIRMPTRDRTASRPPAAQ